MLVLLREEREELNEGFSISGRGGANSNKRNVEAAFHGLAGSSPSSIDIAIVVLLENPLQIVLVITAD